MSRICRACSTANDTDATTCVTCGEALASEHTEYPARVVEPLHTTPAIVRHDVQPAEALREPYPDALHVESAPAAKPVFVMEHRPVEHAAPLEERPEERSEATTYLPTFGASLLDDSRHLEGIGGWLLLVGLIVVAAPVMLVITIVRSYAPMFLNPDLWNMLQEQPRLHALVTAEAATNAVCFLIAVALVYLFFAKKKMFPSLMIFYLVLHAAFFIADLVFTYVLVPNTTFRAQDFGAAGRSVLLAIIVIPYLAMSRRVKVTFVN